MRKEYDFSQSKRAKNISHLAKLQSEMKNKTRITIMLDNDVIEGFRSRAKAAHTGYQTEINRTLRAALSDERAPLTAETLRRILREELH